MFKEINEGVLSLTKFISLFFNLGMLLFSLFQVQLLAEEYRVNDKLARIKIRVEEAVKVLEQSTKDCKMIETVIVDKRKELDRLRTEIEKATNQLNQSKGKLNTHKAELVRIESQTNRVKQRIKKRIRALYLSKFKNSSSQAISPLLLLGKNSSIDPVKFAFFSSKIHQRDQNVLEKLKGINRSKTRQSQNIKEAILAHQKLINELKDKQNQEEISVHEIESALVKLSEKEARHRLYLSKLNSQYAKVERVVTSLTTKSISDGKVENRKLDLFHDQAANLKGLTLYSRWPVSGSVLRGFGKYRVEAFEELNFFKGILFKTARGARVRALESGIVKFVGEMPAYGLVLILDHGGRDYSLYGLLSVVTAQVGSFVKIGSDIGRASVSESNRLAQSLSGGNFYLELRRAGKPMDPTKLVKVN